MHTATTPYPLSLGNLLGLMRRIFAAHYLTFLGIVTLPEILLLALAASIVLGLGVAGIFSGPGPSIGVGALSSTVHAMIAGAVAYVIAQHNRGHRVSALAAYRYAARQRYLYHLSLPRDAPPTPPDNLPPALVAKLLGASNRRALYGATWRIAAT